MIERKRHLAKAITYRIFGSSATATIAYLATGSAGLGATAGLADGFVKVGLYYVHERAWYHIKWGVRKEGEKPA